MAYPPNSLTAGKIPLRDFLYAPDLFDHCVPFTVWQCLSPEEQQSYLTAVFKSQQENIPRPILRKQNGVLEVHEGWQYVDTLIRFFKNEIQVTYEISCLFSDAFHSDVSVDMTTTHKLINDEDFYYSHLR